MAENLAYLPAVSQSSAESAFSPYYYVYDYKDTIVKEAKETVNYTTYGVLYNGEATKTACPSDWHLPSDVEWQRLEIYLGVSESEVVGIGYHNTGSIGKALRSTSGWNENGNGDNSSGFTAIPGGYRSNGGGFRGLGSYAFFWSASEIGSSNAWGRGLGCHGDGVFPYGDTRSIGFSVRCLQN